MGRDDQKTSNNVLIGLGVGLITAVTGLACAGTYSAINAMNRQSEEAILAAQQAVDAAKDKTGGDVVDVPEEPTTPAVTDDMSDQLKWMHENGITYNEYGLPVDKDGNLVDDPTTEVYDPSREAYFFNEDGTPKKPYLEELPGEEDEKDPKPTEKPDDGSDTTEDNTDSSKNDPVAPPEVETPEQPSVTEPETSGWWLDSNGNLLSGLSLDDNGRPYYVVKSGDWLIKIADRFGFDYMDLARESGIDDPSLILPGQIIRFPDKTGSISNSTAPGRG